MAITFTQYHLPDGHKTLEYIDMPEDVEAKASAVIEAGYEFDAEILTNGVVSFTCMNKSDDEDCVAIELSANGPTVPSAVASLIETAYQSVVVNKRENKE
jgi:hypothetical protein